MTVRDDWWKGKLSRADADYQRETFTALHQRQQEHFAFVRDQQDWVAVGYLPVDSYTRLKFFTILLDPVAGIWLSLAQQKARAAYLIGKRVWHHEFNIGIVDVTIDLHGRTVYVMFKSGLPLYEFFTPDHVLLQNGRLGSPGHTASLDTCAVCGSLTQLRGKHGKPKLSHVLTPGIDDGWTQHDCTEIVGPGLGYKIFGAWQNQKFFEALYWPNNGSSSLVTSTQAQAPGWNSQCGWLSAGRTSRGLANSGIYTSDIGLDEPPGFFSAGGGYKVKVDFTSAYVWWRRAATQVVNGKTFCIATDNAGRMHIFKVVKPTLPDAPFLDYRTYFPPYPDWVTLPDVDDPRVQWGNWLWNFNKDGTKAVTCPFNSVDGPFYKHLNQPFGAILPETVATIASPTAFAREDRPGMVEIGLVITDLGEGALDFEVAMTLLRNCYSGTDNRYIVDAAYFLPDVDKIGVPEGTLITAEVECYVQNSGEYHAGPEMAPGYAIETQQAFHALDSYLVINRNDLKFVPTEVQKLKLWSPISGRFLTINGYRYVGKPAGYTPLTFAVPLAAGGLTSVGDIGPVQFSVTAPDPDRGATLTYIWALELRTLSMLYTQEDQVAGTYSIRGLAYNTEFHERHGLISTKAAPSFGPRVERVPTTAHLVHNYMWALALNTEWGMGFNIHPAGHWSLAVNYTFAAAGWDDDFDWISIKNRNGSRTKYTHLALFNEAFKQTRAYSFWKNPAYYYPAQGVGLADYANPRSNGVFYTF